MLIDILLNHDIENVAPESLAPLRRRLGEAQKFELAPDFAAAAEELASDLKTVAGALPYCRLPYPLVWIEVAQQHRPRFAAAEIHMPTIQGLPTRIGFLLESPDLKRAPFTAYQFWELSQWPKWPQASHIAMRFDPSRFADAVPAHENGQKEERLIKTTESPEWQKASPQVRAQLLSAVNAVAAPFASATLLTAIMGGDHDRTARVVTEIGIVDWAGETIYLLAVLALLNTLNATQAVRTDFRRLNVARAKARKPPVSDYHVLKIHPRLKARIVGDSDAHGHRELRAHMVRGHWKVRRSGIFFWRPYTRGTGKPVDKTYLVQ